MYALRNREFSGMSSLHTFLNDEDWNLEKMKKYLERNSSSINEVNVNGETPVIVVLKNKNCSVEILKLLFEHGADIHCKDPSSGQSPLILALDLSRDKKIIKVLVDKSSNFETDGMSLLCIAMANSMNVVVRLLLEKGFGYDNCERHGSLLHCASSFPKSGLRKDIFKTLLKMETNVNYIDEDNQTPMCLAFQNGAEPCELNLLLDAGASLYACEKHEFSPLFCITDGHYVCWIDLAKNVPLKSNMVKWLLDAGVRMDKTDAFGCTLLQVALAILDYDIEAIKMLLDLPGLDINILSNSNESLLYLAACNPRCKPEIVQMLIDRKVPTELETINSDTALIPAIQDDHLTVVKLLVKNGCPIDDINILILAFYSLHNYSLLKVLLMAGAKVVNRGFDPFHEVLFRGYDEDDEESYEADSKECFELALKFMCLQDPGFYFKFLKLDYTGHYENNLRVANTCVHEISKMKIKQVGHGHTLLDVVQKPFLPQMAATDYKPEEQIFNLDMLLGLRPDKEFPTYFEVIAGKVGRWAMEAKLKKLLFCTFKKSLKSSFMEKVNLSYECVIQISHYLTEEDFMKFILGLYRPDSNRNSKTENNRKRKRNSEELC